MTFKESVKFCLGPGYFFRFKGRAPRSEFWWFMLLIFLVNLVSGLVCAQLPAMLGASLSLIVSLLLFPANLGVTVRRFHDRNLSGWWLLAPTGIVALWVLAGFRQTGNNAVALLSLAMSMGYLLILCLPGTPGPNRFGPDPLARQ